MASKVRVITVAGESVALLWGAYSFFTTARDIPDDAGELAKMLADPPLYLPWGIAAVFLLALVCAFWPAKKLFSNSLLPKQDQCVASARNHVVNGDNRGVNGDHHGDLHIHEGKRQAAMDANKLHTCLLLTKEGQTVVVRATGGAPESAKQADELVRYLRQHSRNAIRAGDTYIDAVRKPVHIDVETTDGILNFSVDADK